MVLEYMAVVGIALAGSGLLLAAYTGLQEFING